MELAEFKKKYGVFAKKHKMPSFKELNEDFEIDKIDKESDCFLRVIRKVMMEKIVNSLNFLELLVNPVNAPGIYHPYIKSMGLEDRKLIEEIHKVLGELSLWSLNLEIEYNEKKEAELISEAFKRWGEVRPKFRVIMQNMRKPNGLGEVRRDRGYFG